MTFIKQENYITIQGWMLHIGCSNWNELAAYALIYGFSQDGRSEFVGSISYIQEWLMCSKRNVSYIMANLVEKGLLVKEQYKINGVKFNRYKAVVPQQQIGSAKIAQVVQIDDAEIAVDVQKLHGGSAKIAPNNIDNNIDNSISSLRSDIQIEYSHKEKEKNNNSLLPPIIPQAETETQQPQTEKAEIITASELEFDEFRKIYRGTKRGLRTEFTNFCKKHKDWKAVLPTLKERYEHQCELKDQARMFGCFVPVEKNLQTYLNQRCWEEEPQFQRQPKRDSEKTIAEKMAEIELDYQINKQYGL